MFRSDPHLDRDSEGAADGRRASLLHHHDFMMVWGAGLVTNIDNFLRPLFISGRANISTLTVFIGVLGGLSAFGMIGLFLGPVVLALVLALIGFAEEARAATGGLEAPNG